MINVKNIEFAFYRMFLPVALICIIACCCRSNKTISPNVHDTDGNDTLPSIRVHILINQHRQQNGLSLLDWSDVIANALVAHTNNMADKSVAFGHDGFSQRDDIIGQSIPHSRSAENVGYNSGGINTAEQMVNSWLSSAGHKANIEGNYNMTGVATAKNSSGMVYYTQFFILKR